MTRSVPYLSSERMDPVGGIPDQGHSRAAISARVAEAQGERGNL